MELGFIGRQREREQALAAIEAGRNVLVVARTGAGKTALMRHIWSRMAAKREAGEIDYPVVWVPSGTTKDVLTKIGRQVHETFGLAMPETLIPPAVMARAKRQGWLPWSDLHRSFNRISSDQKTAIIIDSIRGSKVLVFLDSLEVPPSQADFFRELMEHAQVVAGMDKKNRRVRIEKLLWKFQVQIELRPLTLDESEELVERFLAVHPMRFTDSKTERRFIRHIARDSHGNPEAIYGMLAVADGEAVEIDPGKVTEMSHEAGRTYFDITPVLIAAMVMFAALRYVARGLSEVEMMVWAGVGSAVFMLARLFLYKLSAKR